MKKKKLINCLSKKFIIKGVATTLVVLLPFSFFKPKETKAIVGVDDAILIATLGTLAVGGTLACYGISKSGVIQKTASLIGDGLQDIGSGFKNVYDDVAVAKGMYDMLPLILNTYDTSVKDTEIQETNFIEGASIPINAPSTLTNDGRKSTLQYVCTFYPIDNNSYTISNFGTYNLSFNVPVHLYTISYCSGMSKSGYNDYYISPNQEAMYTDNDGYFQASMFTNDCINIHNGYIRTGSSKNITVTDNCKVGLQTVYNCPTLSDVENPPASISLDKSKAEAMAMEYSERYPSDNNGDKKVNYSDLIPFILNLMSKDLGDGTITPRNLSSHGMVSYVYENGQTQGMYPYDFGEQGSSDVTVNNNININNGSEVSDEEKNGILNILDNGVRKTTTLLSNLKNSMSNLANALQGLFGLLPEPVGYLFYSALCLSLIFFILSLRR